MPAERDAFAPNIADGTSSRFLKTNVTNEIFFLCLVSTLSIVGGKLFIWKSIWDVVVTVRATNMVRRIRAIRAS